jgi:hypothetical protein
MLALSADTAYKQVTGKSFSHLKEHFGLENMATLFAYVLRRNPFFIVNDCRINMNALNIFAPPRKVVFLEGPNLVQISEAGSQLEGEKLDHATPRHIFCFKKLDPMFLDEVRHLPAYGWVGSTDQGETLTDYSSFDAQEKIWVKGGNSQVDSGLEKEILEKANKSGNPDSIISKEADRLFRLVTLGVKYVQGKNQIAADKLKKALSCSDEELNRVLAIAHADYFTILTAPLRRPPPLREFLSGDFLANKAKTVVSRVKGELGEQAFNFNKPNDASAKALARWIKSNMDSVLNEYAEGLTEAEVEDAASVLFFEVCKIEKGPNWIKGDR